MDQFHAGRRFLKSARLSRDTVITWHFDIADSMKQMDPIYVHLPQMLCVTKLKIIHPSSPNSLVKCTWGWHDKFLCRRKYRIIVR